MANKAKIFFIFIFCFCFADLNKELVNFDKNFNTSSQKSIMHNKLKDLYIKASIDNDKNAKIQILKRLLISSKALNLNSQNYEKELKSLNYNPQNNQTIQKNIPKKTTQTKQNNIKKDNIINKTQNTLPKTNKSKIIVIDPGHGGKDSGAVNGKLLEKNIVLNVSLKLGEELKKRGYNVFYTRSKDIFINLRDRTKVANDKKANLFISIHANAAANKTRAKKAQGIETFFLSPARSDRSAQIAATENQTDLEEMNYFGRQTTLHSLSRDKIIASNKLAIDVQKNILNILKTKYNVVDGGVREGPFWVLVGAQDMPAILLEIGYISHPQESKRISDNAFQALLAKGIADGIDNYFYHNP